jgi:hypothetical protein
MGRAASHPGRRHVVIRFRSGSDEDFGYMWASYVIQEASTDGVTLQLEGAIPPQRA